MCDEIGIFNGNIWLADCDRITTGDVIRQRRMAGFFNGANDERLRIFLYRKECWKGLRTFIYSSGPVYLTKVVNLPKVPEFKDG